MARSQSRAAARAKRRAKRPLSRAQRLARSPRPPDGPTLVYLVGIRRAAEAYAKAVRAALLPKLETFALREEHRADAAMDTEAARVISSVASQGVTAAVAKAKRAIGTVPDAVHRHSVAEFKRIGIPIRKEPGLGKLMDEWRTHNVQKVKSLLDNELEILEKLLRESEGRTPKQLADRIEERLEVTRSKAEFLARDQTLTLNGQITRARQVAAGIEEFEWTSSKDERVRESHRALDGERFRWDDPPVVDGEQAIPGEPPQCRCTATPVIPELE